MSCGSRRIDRRSSFGGVVDMNAVQEREYGKEDLVRLLTGAKTEGLSDWLDAAMRAELTVAAGDMPAVHRAVMSYKANRVRNYGEEGTYTRYFAPAFDAIDGAFQSRDFPRFRDGCALLLDLIAAD